MTDKTIEELAKSVNSPVEKLLEQVRDAGLPQRTAGDIISTAEQEKLVGFMQGKKGNKLGAGNITLKRKTTSTAKVADTTGRAKTINVEVRKKQTFVKPDPAQLAAEAKAKLEAEAKAKTEQDADAKSKGVKPSEQAQPENKAKANLEAMRAAAKQQHAAKEAPKAAVVVKRKSTNKPVVKAQIKQVETLEQKKAREAQAAQLKATE